MSANLEEIVTAAVLAELNDFIDPPMTTGLTVVPEDRALIAHRVAQRVSRQFENKADSNA
ncbi:MAG TPA: hypothetical protein VH206_17285 [Xanthobacteraceae bacterium]|nr:hypothetical protein [Xanthobacteraceae bacterium]